MRFQSCSRIPINGYHQHHDSLTRKIATKPATGSFAGFALDQLSGACRRNSFHVGSTCLPSQNVNCVLQHPIHSSWQAITLRLASPRTKAVGLPSLTKRATWEAGGAGAESGVDMGDRQPRHSRRGSRRSRESTRTDRRYGASNGTPACSSRGHRRRGGRGGTLSGDRYEEGVGRSRSGAPDDATSIWSGWHTTGIPSWDILVSEILGEALPSSMVFGSAPFRPHRLRRQRMCSCHYLTVVLKEGKYVVRFTICN